MTPPAQSGGADAAHSLIAQLGEAQADLAWNVQRRKALAVTLNQQRVEIEGLRNEIERLTTRVAELEGEAERRADASGMVKEER